MWNCKCGERNLNTAYICKYCGSSKSDLEITFQDFQEIHKSREEQIERERVQQQHKTKMENLTNMGFDGYYEYKVLSLLDERGLFRKDSGKADILTMTKVLNELGLEGWHLVTAYSNELGKNALSGGAGGAMFGVNSTVDENILIFERFVKIK